MPYIAIESYSGCMVRQIQRTLQVYMTHSRSQISYDMYHVHQCDERCKRLDEMTSLVEGGLVADSRH